MTSSKPPGLYWLASYPKSGNTWLRFLLAHLLRGGLGSSAEVAAAVPDLHKQNIVPRPDGPTLAKTHLPWSPQHPGAALTRGAVLLLRHPLDVALSVANHVCRARQHGATAADVARRTGEMMDLFLDSGGFAHTPQWQQFGTWAGHAASWQAAPFPVLTLRYEGLLADPAEQLGRLSAHVGLDAGPDAIAAAVAACDFAQMAQLEAEETAAALPGLFTQDVVERPELRFINRGEAGRWRAMVGESQLAAIDARHGAAIRALGYEL